MRDDFLDILYDFTREEDHTVFFSSHIVSDLEKLCDYIAVLHKGKLLLCEEKDILLEKYCMIKCSADDAAKIGSSDIIGKRQSPYGVQAVVKRESVPRDMTAENISIEDLFVYLVRGGYE